MNEFKKRKIDQMIEDLSPDDLDDVRDMVDVGDKLFEFISQQELRMDLWSPLLLAICRAKHDKSMACMVNPITFEQYLVRYSIEAERALKSCDG